MDGAFQFIINNGGLTTEANYAYMAENGQCKTTAAANNAASIKGYEDVPTNDESSLMKAVAGQPVSVAVDASNFQFYQGGVMSGSCGTDLDHGVTVIGYGTASDGTKYWLIKNSWGTTWGESRYLRMEKDIDDNRGSACLCKNSSKGKVRGIICAFFKRR
uniref:Peptidase C1A papain C-terminal domain-containing protein n=1 Tax=Leersia perrieri TaxID=77586 RepID=A0A0D9XYE4_9ORYZ